MFALIIQAFLLLIVFYGVGVTLLKYCILRRPQIKTKLVTSTNFTKVEDLKENQIGKETDRWCIIGAGFAGITMASKLQQNQIPFTIFEKYETIGGNWQQGTYTGVHTISSKNITEISDFPMPQHFPDFPSAEQVRGYLNDYVDHFHLREHIRFDSEVKEVHPISDGYQWEISLSNGKKLQYKGVIICNGHDWDPVIPCYEGKSNIFTMHSREYKNPEILKNKRVLTVGGGNSGVDISCEAARFAEKSVLSLRRGYWFVPRTLFGKPTFELIPHWLPTFFQQLYIKFGFRCMYGKLSDYGLPKPQHNIYDHHLSITDQIFHDIRKGRLHVYPAISSIHDKIVTFVDGKQEEFDLIVFATGYKNSIPMADHILDYKNGLPQLVHGVVHPSLKNCYVLGFGFARSGAGPLLHAASLTITRSIRIQDKIRIPLGKILLKTGSRIPQKGKYSKDIIIDPYKAFGKEFLGRFCLPLVPFLEKYLFKPHLYDPDIVAKKYEKK